MRLYQVEWKRILKAFRTRVIMLLAVILPVLLAVLASEFNDANILDESGNTVSLHGIAALRFIEENSAGESGEVTVERLKTALLTYQRLYDDYETDPLGSGFPLDVYWKEVQPVRPLLRMITQAYSTPEAPADLRTIAPDELDSFYADAAAQLTTVMTADQELRDPATIAKAKALYRNIKTPFYIVHGYTRDAFDYLSFAILILTILAVTLAAPVFSERYGSGEDSVLRCTLHGRGTLVRTAVLAELTVVTIMYVLGIGLYLLISDRIFGVETLRASVQTLYTVYSLPNMSLFGLQLTLFFAGWLCCMTVTVMALCISAKVTETSTATVLSLVIVILPTLLYSVGGGVSWLLALFPSASVGLSNNLLMSLVDLRFLTLFGRAFWYPAVLMVTAVAELVLFWIFAKVFYARYQVAK